MRRATQAPTVEGSAGRLQACPKCRRGVLLEASSAPGEDPGSGRLRSFPETSPASRFSFQTPPLSYRAAIRRVMLPRIPIDGAVLCDFGDLDRAGRWCECSNPNCPDAAYLVELFPTVADACTAGPDRAERWAQRFLPSDPQQALEAHALQVRRIRSTRARGHDYRSNGCGIADAAAQLRAGRGLEPAWQEIKRQRVEEGADGALLESSRTPGGLLFLYASRLELLDVNEVVQELTYPFR